MMFVLFNLGAGSYSIDSRFSQHSVQIQSATVSLLLRLSLAVVFLVAGIFNGYANIQSFASASIILIPIGVLLLLGSNTVVRYVGMAVIVTMGWFILQKFSIDKTLIQNLNGFKREFALLAAGVALAYLGGGERYTLMDVITRSRQYIGVYFVPKSAG
jgi:uncharacterized membrane protein YphA (DoxX/SURF4 family)